MDVIGSSNIDEVIGEWLRFRYRHRQQDIKKHIDDYLGEMRNKRAGSGFS